MQNAGRVLSKAQILDHVWNYDFGGEANVVESYVSYLRRKVDTTEPRLLHTLRGVGYVLRDAARVSRRNPARVRACSGPRCGSRWSWPSSCSRPSASPSPASSSPTAAARLPRRPGRPGPRAGWRTGRPQRQGPGERRQPVRDQPGRVLRAARPCRASVASPNEFATDDAGPARPRRRATSSAPTGKPVHGRRGDGDRVAGRGASHGRPRRCDGEPVVRCTCAGSPSTTSRTRPTAWCSSSSLVGARRRWPCSAGSATSSSARSPAPAGRGRADRGRDRRRRPEPPGAGDRRAHRGRPAARCASTRCSARSSRRSRPRGVRERGARVRGADAPVRRRRQPRAAHAADVDPRLRRALPPGRGRRTGRAWTG